MKVFTTPTCHNCPLMKDYLTKKGIKFQSVDVTKDKNGLEEMVRISGRRAVPTLEHRGKVVVGFNEQEINKFLVYFNLL
jgi:glutaredoxin-like YruB-family protein